MGLEIDLWWLAHVLVNALLSLAVPCCDPEAMGRFRP
jgi:hypothetical protein